MRPIVPECCPINSGCCGTLRYKGSYPRQLIVNDFCANFGVHRYVCRECGGSLSFLPDFCVPYKHYGATVICRILSLLLLARKTIAATASTKLNQASVSRSCIREWLRQFRENANNLRQFGLPPLIGEAQCVTDDSLFQRLRDTAVSNGFLEERALCFWQVKLSERQPPLGVFRAVLLPGFST